MAIELMFHIWNHVVSLQRPVFLDTIKSLIAPAILERVYENVDTWLYGGGNIAFRLPLLSAHRSTGRVQAIVLALCPDFFAENARIATDQVSGLSILGISIPMSATEMLQALKTRGVTGLSLTTDSDRWTLIYGDSLVFEFRPIESRLTDPDYSRMVGIEFSLNLPFTGRFPPFLVQV